MTKFDQCFYSIALGIFLGWVIFACFEIGLMWGSG